MSLLGSWSSQKEVQQHLVPNTGHDHEKGKVMPAVATWSFQLALTADRTTDSRKQTQQHLRGRTARSCWDN